MVAMKIVCIILLLIVVGTVLAARICLMAKDD